MFTTNPTMPLDSEVTPEALRRSMAMVTRNVDLFPHDLRGGLNSTVALSTARRPYHIV